MSKQMFIYNYGANRENITKDIYIYLEEVEALRRFEFWPHKAIDIEKPSSAAEEH